jgi:enolase
VTRAVRNVEDTIGPALLGLDATRQREVDRILLELDGTDDKSKLGANALLGVSLAVAKAAASSCGLPLYAYVGGAGAHLLPVPQLNIINGGAHADNALDVQEFMIVPTGAASFAEALRIGAEVYQVLKGLLGERGLSTALGDEGGFAPHLDTNEEALALLVEAVGKAGYEPGEDVVLALDVAASELHDSGRYRLSGEGRMLEGPAMVDWLADLAERFPLVSIEDGMDEDDWVGWSALTERVGDTVQVVGDDLLVTNVDRVGRGSAQGAANSVRVMVILLGTLTQTLVTVATAHRAGWTTVFSHRSGETEDTTIADLAVATGVGQIKTGAPARSDRVAKYNQLLRIEEHLGDDARYAGWTAFPRARRGG